VRDVLVGALNVHAVVIGYDHRFGRNREGDLAMLHQLGEAYDFTVEEIPAQEIDHVKVSSTKIRTALLAGEVPLANDLLGYPYAFSGVVVKGDQRGRTIGFPTANIALVDQHKLVPGNGVYAVEAEIRGERLRGMMNIGVRPSVEERVEPVIEVNLFEVDRDLYGEPMTVTLRHRLRSEMRFDGLDALKQQLVLDRAAALQALSA
jgi:riboflavin kinase/FMN adenylyltransferase